MNETTPDAPAVDDDVQQEIATQGEAASLESAAPQESTAPQESAAPSAVSADTDTDADNDADDQAAEERAGGDPSDDDQAGESAEERLRRLEEEGDIAADYLEELLDIADLDGDIDIDVDGDRASVEIRGADRLAELNRPKGELLDALQELARLAVQTRTGSRSRLMLDIGGFRAEHKGGLEELAATAIAEAKETGAPVPLRPMNPFERKVVHDVAKREGLRSESDGDGKGRHVVIYPAS